MSESKSLWGILYDLGAVRCSCRQPEDRNLDLRDQGQGAADGTVKEAAPCGSSWELECSMGSCVLSALLFFLAYRGEDASGQGHITFGFGILQKQGGRENGVELNFGLFQTTFLMCLPQ